MVRGPPRCNVEARGWGPGSWDSSDRGETRTTLPFTDPGALPSTIQFVGNGRLVHAPHSRGMHDSRICIRCLGTYRGNAKSSPLEEHLAETHAPRISTSRLRVAGGLPIDRPTVPTRAPPAGSFSTVILSRNLGNFCAGGGREMFWRRFCCDYSLEKIG